MRTSSRTLGSSNYKRIVIAEFRPKDFGPGCVGILRCDSNNAIRPNRRISSLCRVSKAPWQRHFNSSWLKKKKGEPNKSYGARHLKQEQERLLFEEQAHRAEEAQRRAEAIAHEVRARSATERATEERLQCERTAHLERVRAEIELDAKLTIMKAEQQQEVERFGVASRR